MHDRKDRLVSLRLRQKLVATGLMVLGIRPVAIKGLGIGETDTSFWLDSQLSSSHKGLLAGVSFDSHGLTELECTGRCWILMLIKASVKAGKNETRGPGFVRPWCEATLRCGLLYRRCYEHVRYRQVGSLNVDRLRTASWLCANSGNRTTCCSITTLCAFRLHCTFTAWLSNVCHNYL